MKKIIFLVILCSVIFINNNFIYAQEQCNAELIIHYHRHNNDYNNYELYIYGHQNVGEIIQASKTDNFGLVFEVPICSISNDNVGIVLKEKDTWNKDGIDVNNDGKIDDKIIDVSDIKGTYDTKHVYVLEGAKDVFEQEFENKTYFGREGYGHVVIIYYDPTNIEDWQDFYIWDVGEDNLSNDINFDYNLGLQGGNNPNLFKVGVINVPNNSEDIIGLIVRKHESWDVKDNEWSLDLIENVIDDNGHMYNTRGDRFINVIDVKGEGYKFIYMIKGDKTLYEDYELFLSKAFPLDFIEAEFYSKNILEITFNQDIPYNPETGPDINRFTIVDKNNKILKIEKIYYDQNKTSDKVFYIEIKDEIENQKYKVKYNYEQFGDEKIIETEASFSEVLFSDVPVENINSNLIYYIIGGIIIILTLGIGAFVFYKRKHN